jgi:hypothetical protein
MGNFKKIFIIIFIVLCFFIFKNAKAATIDLTGWAWAENVGWISFNSLNCDANGDGKSDGSPPGCPPAGTPMANYGVNLNPSTKVFSGYAWSENIGWITFNESELSGCPQAPCRAWLGSDNKVYGWARALANGGGWDGWIRLRDTNYGVWLDTSTSPQEFREWAWSDMVIGWISFNCKDRNVCATSNYKVYLTAPLNQPPSATNLQESFQYCCIQDGVGRMGMSWTYSDPENTNQSAYGIWVQQFIGGTWVDKVYCEEIPTASPPSGGIGTSAVLIKSNPTGALCDYPSYVGDIEYGRQTRWRVKVKDGDGIWSDWTDWTTPTTTADHAYPWIDFSWTPQNPTVGQVVQFYDQSKCYDTAGTTTCSNSTGDSFFWTFQNGNPPSSTSSNPTTTFTSVGSNLVTLRVTDSSNYSCEIQKTVTSTYPLPFWKEIPPIFFKIRDFLASLIFSISKIRLF